MEGIDLSASTNQLETVDLTNCDREPIHIPGSIQPHGALLVLRDPDLSVERWSLNASHLLGVNPIDLPDCSLQELFGIDSSQAVRDCLERNFDRANPLPLTLIAGDRAPYPLNGIAHRAPSGEIVLELEPCDPAVRRDFFAFYQQIKDPLAKIQSARDLQQLCDFIVAEIRDITRFDRVMVYRFSDSGDGEVIAEARSPDTDSFLGLHYPDTDICKPAKELYTLNWLRLIPDVNYQPIGIVTSQTDPEAPPLDMSYCVLRSVSPMHVEYLQNMGVMASMSISLIQNQRLWGLIACHHNTPKWVPYEIRTACEFLGQLMSTEIANKEANENLEYKLHLKDIQGQFIDRLSGASDFTIDLTQQPEMLLELTGAQGVAVCEGKDIVTIGSSPSPDRIADLLAWLVDRFDRNIFVTDALGKLYPKATEYKAIASGFLAMEISKIQHRYVLWFRPEQLQSVSWGGKPENPKRVEADGSVTLFPRRSFEVWQEIVRGRSTPWLPCEVEGAVELRQAIVDIVLRHADDLASINVELERSNSELDSFTYIASHDLKEPLRGIHNYATFLIEDYESLLPEDGKEKLDIVMRLTKRMQLLIDALLKFSRLGRQALQMQPIDLNQLLNDISKVFQMNPQWNDCEIRIPKPLPPIWGDPALVEEIFTNLISNGFKYNKSSQKWVEVGCLASPAPPGERVTLYVKDNGIGIREKHLESIFTLFKRLHGPSKYGGGTGAGLTIVQKIVERHGGTLQVESIYEQGTTFRLTLPTQAPPTLN